MCREFLSTCKDLKSGRSAAVQTLSNVLEGFQNASRFRDETRSKNSHKKLATPEGNSQLGSNRPNSKAPENSFPIPGGNCSTDTGRRRVLEPFSLLRNVQRFRGGLVFKARRLCVSLNSRLESNKEEEDRRTCKGGGEEAGWNPSWRVYRTGVPRS